jgi:Mrp family chromosome partitioning ATPase
MNTTLARRSGPLSFAAPSDGVSKQLVKAPTAMIAPSLMIQHQGLCPAASEYLGVANNLLYGCAQSPARIFVTSPRHGDGKTCTAFNLAWAFTGCEKSVLLVELNFSKPQFTTVLGSLGIRYGLDSALRGKANPEDSVFAIAPSGMNVAAVREATPLHQVANLLEHLDAFLDWGSEHYDIVVIDCPPVISKEWGVWFSKFIGSALLVVREGKTPLVDVRRASKLLGNHLMSVLLNAQQGGSTISALVPGKRHTTADSQQDGFAKKDSPQRMPSTVAAKQTM